MRGKKVLLINWRDIRNPEAGGAEIYYHEIFKRIAANGCAVTVLCHAFAGCAAEETIDGVRVLRMGSRSLFNWQIIPWVRKHQTEFDLIVEDLNKIPFFTPLYVHRPRLHLAMHFFGLSIFSETIPPLAAYVYLLEKLIRVVYRREKFIAISDSTQKEVAGFLSDKSNVSVVEPGIDTAYYKTTKPKSGTPLLVYVSRLKKYKNAQFLIRALPGIRRQVPDVRLRIGGSGDYRGALEKLVRQLSLGSAVEFTGFISESAKRDLLSEATLFVNPSRKEGWGINNIEANLCGTVSISANVAGLRDSVRDGETGVLYSSGSQRDFIEKTTALLQDTQRRTDMETRALETARSFDWYLIARRMETELDKQLVPQKERSE